MFYVFCPCQAVIKGKLSTWLCVQTLNSLGGIIDKKNQCWIESVWGVTNLNAIFLVRIWRGYQAAESEGIGREMEKVREKLAYGKPTPKLVT